MQTSKNREHLRWLDWAVSLGRTRVTVGVTMFCVLTSLALTAGLFVSQGKELEPVGWAAAILAPAAISPTISWFVMGLVIRIHSLEQEMRSLATHDPLTGLYNRRAFLLGLDHLSKLARRGRHPIALVFIDIDHFKSINDRYGHAVGDQAIKAVANVLKASVRESDIYGRFGGEEFVLAMLITDERAAMAKAELLRRKVEAMSVPVEGDAVLKCTVSLGRR